MNQPQYIFKTITNMIGKQGAVFTASYYSSIDVIIIREKMVDVW